MEDLSQESMKRNMITLKLMNLRKNSGREFLSHNSATLKENSNETHKLLKQKMFTLESPIDNATYCNIEDKGQFLSKFKDQFELPLASPNSDK